MINEVIFQFALGLSGATISFLLIKQSVLLPRTSILVLMFVASSAACISYVLPWLFAPAMVGWFLLSTVFFLLTLFDEPKKNIGLSSTVFAFACVGLLSVFLHPPFMFEFVFKLVEPRDCAVDLAPVHTTLPLPNASPELYENIVALEDGRFIVTAATRGEVIEVTETGETQVLSKLPTGSFDLKKFNGMLSGVTQGQDKAIYTMVLASESANRGIWRIDDKGNAKLWSPFPVHASGNGLTTDESGNMYTADSILGLIWKTKPTGGAPEKWIEHKLLGAGAKFPLPTANGIKLSGESAFITNTLQKQVVRVEIKSDGTAGQVEVWDKGIGADDFDIDSSGRLYITTHPFNTVVRLEPGEVCSIVGDVSIGIAGPTAAVFGARAEDSSILYVLNDGGYSRAVEGGQPSIIGLDLARQDLLNQEIGNHSIRNK